MVTGCTPSPLGRLFVHAMFDEAEEDGCFLQDDWEDAEEQERLQQAVAEAASLGLLGDQSDDVQLPLAASSSSDGVTDVCATPPRKNIPLNSDASMEKGLHPSSKPIQVFVRDFASSKRQPGC